MKATELLRFIRYCIVGAMNTAITLGVIFLCHSLLGLGEYLSNGIGYIAGLINSFLWNRAWVFRAQGSRLRQAVRFALGFAICYGLQLAVVFALCHPPLHSYLSTLASTLTPYLSPLTSNLTLTGYAIATLIGNIAYTLLNYLYNKHITFRPTPKN